MQNNLKISSDVWFCAFLLKKGLKIKEYDVIDKGRVRCKFDITDSEWKSLKLEFNSSELSEYKTIIDKLKDLAF